MATALIEKSKEMDIETSSLKLITEMSFAYKRHDYSWFNKNYHRICEWYSLLNYCKPISVRRVLFYVTFYSIIFKSFLGEVVIAHFFG